MKFKNVKEGDIVLTWEGGDYTPSKVTRVTNTQFVLENGLIFKKGRVRSGVQRILLQRRRLQPIYEQKN